jgi:hypothetical protein
MPLRLSFCALVLALAVFQFSENTADPDLWGHIVFGQEMLHTGHVTRTEHYSWTARGQPWINHECLAELALGGAHALLGGSGILLLKVVVGLLTFLLCLRMGRGGLAWPARLVTWAFGALAVVELSYGFAARPQIFTALALALELALLRQVHAGRRMWALALPVLFAFWINTHGGVLAGCGLLGLAAIATTGQICWHRISHPNAGPRSGAAAPSQELDWNTAITLWFAVVGAAAALLCNPWGLQLPRWLIGSVLWLRPQIGEWNPTPLNWDHAALFAIVALGAFAWACSRRRKTWWELAAFVAFALLALRSVRNAPLCALVALALVPPYLADALARFRDYFRRWEALGRNPAVQKAATAALAACAGAICVATFTLHKEHPLTMEAPRSEYPLAAVDFLRAHDLHGRLLVYFDWGELAIFSLPDCPPSIDGRLDTCYSREFIKAHWQFYNAAPFDSNLLNPDAADLALLPPGLAGAVALSKRPGWRAVYVDDVAVLLARDQGRLPKLQGLALPVEGSRDAALGRAPFPDWNPRSGIR